MVSIMSVLQDDTRKVDDALILQIASGDKDALHALYNSISGNVYGFALSILKNQHDADDVLQETFLKVYSGAGSYKPCGKPLAWVFTIAKNLAYTRLRDCSRVSEFDDDGHHGFDLSSIENAERRMLIDTLFRVLSDDEKQIVIMHAVNGIKHREIAQVTGLSLGTVLSKYNRALKKLREEAK